MSNAKVQMPNQIQSSNEMPKQVRHDKKCHSELVSESKFDFEIWISLLLFRDAEVTI
jgi:hypothetical protein